jgi:hypothetical protein
LLAFHTILLLESGSRFNLLSRKFICVLLLRKLLNFLKTSAYSGPQEKVGQILGALEPAMEGGAQLLWPF